jgi:hypothetical protein
MPKRTLPAVILTIVLYLWLLSAPCGAQGDGMAWTDMDRSLLQVAVELASDMAAAPGADRQQHLDTLYQHLEGVDAEHTFAEELLAAARDREFTALVAAEGERPIDYVIAARRSYSRLKTAESAGERDWISRHHTAAKKYVALAAEALRRQAAENENAAAKLQTERFAVRRSPEEAERFLKQLKRDGLSQKHRKLLSESGLSPEEIAAYQQIVQATPAAELGVSMVELYRKIAETRRQLATSLDEFARDHRWVSGPLGDSFLVGNPHDREAVVQLLVRRVAMPPEWTVSLSEVEPATGEKAAKRLKEVEKGKRYEVRLPAGGQIRVASEVTPVGVVAENTTARWAIEGMIGGELLGGIVQEVNVPGFLPDLQLPAIAAAQPQVAAGEAAPATQPTAGWRRSVVVISAAVALFVIALAVVLLRRRKRLKQA